jgi:hypothetical protein
MSMVIDSSEAMRTQECYECPCLFPPSTEDDGLGSPRLDQ